MFIRIWAFLLIGICAFNAVGVSGSSLLSIKSKDFVEHTLSQDISQAPILKLIDHDHTSDNDGHSNCDMTHQCHLGHCHFLVTAVSKFLAPDLTRFTQILASVFYLSADLSGPIKPPRA